MNTPSSFSAHGIIHDDRPKTYFVKTEPTPEDTVELKNSGIASWALSRMQLARNQSHRLNLLIIGPEGVGKRTLINTLFNKSIITTDSPPIFDDLRFVTHTAECVEGGVKLLVEVTEVQGFQGSLQFNDPLTSKQIIDYLQRRYKAIYETELQRGPSTCYFEKRDELIQGVIYCIPPTSKYHQFSKAELDFFHQVQQYSVLIPIICKADMYTIRAQFEALGLEKLPKVISFLDHSSPSTTFLFEDFQKIESSWPFALIGATHTSPTIRTRAYPWANIDVDKEEYSDLYCLQLLLISTFKCFIDRFIVEHLYEGKHRLELMMNSTGRIIINTPQQKEQGTFSPVDIATNTILTAEIMKTKLIDDDDDGNNPQLEASN